MRISSTISILSVLFLFAGPAAAQYVVWGDATQLSCNCYRLTEAVNSQSGAVWNENLISLNDPFDFTFDVYLGDQNTGADGLAFVLQPLSTSTGSLGGGVGYEGITPSVAIELDTYPNAWDPIDDHIAIQSNGVTDHNAPENLAGPEVIGIFAQQLEDDEEHTFRIVWDPGTLTLEAYVDGNLEIDYSGDIVTNIFGNDPMVYWGFSGSTGGLNNEHRFCLAIIPEFTLSEADICQGETITVSDNSYSALGNVVGWNWDFGNGESSTLEFPGPVVYNEAGVFQIDHEITDAAGCSESSNTTIVVHPQPVTNFSADPVCLGEQMTLFDETVSGTGTLTGLDWDLGDGTTANNSTILHTYQSAGVYDVMLSSENDQGCEHDTILQVEVFDLPVAAASDSTNQFTVFLETPNAGTDNIEWLVDGTTSVESPFEYTFSDTGDYEVTLLVTNANGCTDSISFFVRIEGEPEYEMSNVFSPNEDGMNEFFAPNTFGYTSAQMEIYNRWGRKIFTYDSAIPDGVDWGWDGKTRSGIAAEAGVYFYILNMNDLNGGTIEESGTVTLIR